MGLCLFSADDYRVWLRDRTNEIKKQRPSFSLRAVAVRLGIDSAHLIRITQGKKHLSSKHWSKTAKIFGLNSQEERYFEALIRFNTAKSAKDCQRFFLEMQAIRGVRYRTLEDDRHEYFSRWHHPVMRTLISLLDFRGTSFKRLGELFRIPLSEETARESVELLMRLGLVEMDSQGILRACDRVLSSGEGWAAEAVLNYQREVLRLVQELLEHTPRSERDVSTLTIPMSLERIPELREKLRTFRQQLIQWAQEISSENVVYQLNVQLFPVADTRLMRRKSE